MTPQPGNAPPAVRASAGAGSWRRLASLAFEARPEPPAASAVPASPTPPAAAVVSSGAAGLTHHQILALVAPFTRRGHRLDLAASQRQQRRLRFQARVCDGAAAPAPGDSGRAGDAEAAPRLTETLTLEHPRPGRFVLQRQLQRHDGLGATLHAAGAQAEALLLQLQSVPAAACFGDGPGYTLVRSGRVTADGRWHIDETTAAVQHTLWLTLHAPTAGGRSARFTLAAQPGRAGPWPTDTLPADLLAVLGWDWSLLQAGPLPGTWCGSVRLRPGGGLLQQDVTRRLDQAGRHLAQVLAEAPARFHERHRRARRAVALRQAVPWLAVLAMALQALLIGPLPELSIEPLPELSDAGLARTRPAAGWLAPLLPWLPLLPPLLLAFFFLRSEAPGLRWPRWPRPLRAQDWPGAAVAAEPSFRPAAPPGSVEPAPRR